MDVFYSEDVVVWDGIRLPMQKIKNGKWTDLDLLDQEDPEDIKENNIHIGRILDANYKKDNLEQEVNKLIHLTKFQLVILLSFLKRYEDLFDGNAGEWTGPPVDIPLKEESNTYHARALPILAVHK